MTWTYSADPTSSKKDAVRWLVGDTNPDIPLVQDEEIYFNLMEVNNEIYRAASNTALNISAFYVGEAQSTSKSVGGLSLSKSFGDKAQRYERLAKDLLMRSRRLNPPHVNADPHALGAEFIVGEFDRYRAVANDWPSGSVTGVTTTYGTGYEPGDEGTAGSGQEPYDIN